MKISAITKVLEQVASLSLQETYDNAGLITGNPGWECTGVITSLDATEAVVKEAIEKKCNLIVAHHPIVFGGLKKITGKNYVEQTIIAAIKNDIAIYAIHTNLDNVIAGVNGRIADKIGLINRCVLQPKPAPFKKLYTYVPTAHLEKVRNALFEAGAGQIGNYSECSFVSPGEGTFKAGAGSSPFVGKPGERHHEAEQKLELVFESWKQAAVVEALLESHPYEEVAYDIIHLDNVSAGIGSGLVGELPDETGETAFLQQLKDSFGLKIIRHTALAGKKVKKIALCGGAGSFLVNAAIRCGADFYITGDMKYHEFFDANGQLVIADIGHYESEQFSIDLLIDLLTEKFPNFAVLKTGVNTNPVQYF